VRKVNREKARACGLSVHPGIPALEQGLIKKQAFLINRFMNAMVRSTIYNV